MSDHHKVWIDSALHDLSAAIYLHQGGFWFHATLCAEQAGEKFGKSILVFSGITDVQRLSHRIPKINEEIEKLGLHSFSEADESMALQMQRTYVSLKYPNDSSDDPPHTLFDRVGSESSIQWALNYLDITMIVIPDVIAMERRDSTQDAFVAAKEIANRCKKCSANPCICDKRGSGMRP